MGFLNNWKTAGYLGYVMHELALEQGASIKKGACHAIVKAYGWKQSTLLVEELKQRLDEPEAYSVVAKMIAYYVFGRELGGQHDQEAAYEFLKQTGALKDLDWSDVNDPVVSKLLDQQKQVG